MDDTMFAHALLKKLSVEIYIIMGADFFMIAALVYLAYKYAQQNNSDEIYQQREHRTDSIKFFASQNNHNTDTRRRLREIRTILSEAFPSQSEFVNKPK